MNYNGAKGYTLKRLDLVTNEKKVISLVNIFNTVSFVEDIFSNFLHGTIVIEDANDLHQIAPIVGEELLYFDYATDDQTDKDVSLVFRVYKIETSEANSDRVAHKLFLVSDEGYLSANVSISKSYRNKSIQYIVSDVFSSISKNKIQFTEMAGKYHIVSPHWTPLQLINYTTSIASPKNFQSSLMMFYQTTDGFKYKHIEDLYTTKSIGMWSAIQLSKHKEGVQDQINPYNNILTYSIVRNSTDTLKSMSEGLYSNTTLSYDNLSKTYRSHVYDYNKNYKDTVHLNSFKLSSKNFEMTSPTQRICYLPSNSHRFDSKYIKDNSGTGYVGDNKEIVQTWKTTLLSQLKAKEIHLDINGNTNVIVGSVMDIEIPNATSLTPIAQDNHRYNNKKVLVTKITNTFTRKTHVMKLVVSDDSYTDELNTHAQFNGELSE